MTVFDLQKFYVVQININSRTLKTTTCINSEDKSNKTHPFNEGAKIAKIRVSYQL